MIDISCIKCEYSQLNSVVFMASTGALKHTHSRDTGMTDGNRTNLKIQIANSRHCTTSYDNSPSRTSKDKFSCPWKHCATAHLQLLLIYIKFRIRLTFRNLGHLLEDRYQLCAIILGISDLYSSRTLIGLLRLSFYLRRIRNDWGMRRFASTVLAAILRLSYGVSG